MKFFPIVPIRYLSLASVSHNHMVLGDYYLRYPRYRNFYLKMKSRGDFIILDNSACELERSIDLGALMDIYRELNPDILVVPDSNDENNLRLFQEAFRELHDRFNIDGAKLMAVPHSARDLEEMASSSRVVYIGLNRQMDDLVDRSYIVRAFKNHPITFHLLGFKKDPLGELAEVKDYDNVLGVDSLLPYRLARLGRRLEESRPFPPNLQLEEEGFLPKVVLRHIKSELQWFIDQVEMKEV